MEVQGLQPRRRSRGDEGAAGDDVADDPDLSAFRAKGGKLLMYHGWSDSALSPLMSIRYFDRSWPRTRSAQNDVKLFMLPGVLHCAGGPGPDRIDYLDALDKWASGGAAPEELTASFAAGGARKVCAYPKKAVLQGHGRRQVPRPVHCRARRSPALIRCQTNVATTRGTSGSPLSSVNQAPGVEAQVDATPQRPLQADAGMREHHARRRPRSRCRRGPAAASRCASRRAAGCSRDRRSAPKGTRNCAWASTSSTSYMNTSITPTATSDRTSRPTRKRPRH